MKRIFVAMLPMLIGIGACSMKNNNKIAGKMEKAYGMKMCQIRPECASRQVDLAHVIPHPPKAVEAPVETINRSAYQ